jgi:arginine repressor
MDVHQATEVAFKNGEAEGIKKLVKNLEQAQQLVTIEGSSTVFGVTMQTVQNIASKLLTEI